MELEDGGIERWCVNYHLFILYRVESTLRSPLLVRFEHPRATRNRIATPGTDAQRAYPQ